MEKINNLQQPRRIEFSSKPLLDSTLIATAETTMASIYSKSWREKFITKDSETFLGGYIWPPRSYSCNFCTREFNSAQALGGHMNVHRRDRARFKKEEEDHQDRLLCKKYITYDTDQNPNPNSYSFDHNLSSSLANDSLANQYFLSLRLKRCFDEEDNEKTWNSKRRKDFICCYVKSYNFSEGLELQVFESEVTNLSPIHVGELDLELRIGRSSA